MSSQSKDGNKEALFRADISDGYTFRNLIEYLKNTNTNGNFVFSKDGISYMQADATNSIVNVVEISKAKLTHYEYNATTPNYPVGVIFTNLRKITKNIGKKDGVRLYMLKGEPLFYIRIISSANKDNTRQNLVFFKIQTINNPPITGLPVLRRGDDDPNVTIPVVEFCKVCSNMCSMGCDMVTLRGFEKGMVFEGALEGHTSGCMEQFGVVRPVTSSDRGDRGDTKLMGKDGADETSGNIRLKISPIKAFSKLNNMTSTGGLVQLYMQKDIECMKLKANIGAYGNLTVYLRNIKQ